MTGATAFLRLARTEGVGPITYRRLLARFGDPEAALEALPALARAGGRGQPVRLCTRDEAEREQEAVARLGGTILFVDTPPYPPRLALLEDAPAALTVLGAPAALERRAVAIVGGRNASANGRRMADVLAEALARAGLVVVSGMARGVDAAAHAGALRGGATVACVAGGIDVPYPLEHAALQAQIAASGAVVSETPLGTAPLARHFPRRNRIIAGLSLGVVVVEAALRSGSLITARLAREAGRDVFAVPGSPLDPRCRGSNDLLRQGAGLVESADDVLVELAADPAAKDGLQLSRPGMFREHSSPLPASSPPPREDPAQADRILELLGPSPTAIDELVRHSHVPVGVVMGALLMLEVAGRVEMLPGNMVALLAEADH